MDNFRLAPLARNDLDLARRWIIRLNSLFAEVGELETQLDKVEVKRYLEQMARGKREDLAVLKLEADTAHALKKYQVARQLLTQWTEREDYTEGYQLLLEVQARASAAWDLFMRHSQALSLVEMWEMLGSGDPPDDLEEAQQRVKELLQQLEIEITATRQLLPTNAELVLK